MTHNNKIKTRFLIISDTHNAMPGSISENMVFREPLPQADVAIHCGDLTMTGKPTEHGKAFQLLKSLRAPLKIVIPGNHDLTLDAAYCKSHHRLYSWNRDHTEEDLESAEEIYTGKAAQAAGICYLEEGLKTFRLQNGADLTIYASAFTPEFYDWAFPYERTEDRFNPQTASHPVPNFCDSEETKSPDVMITHGPPQDTLDETISGIPAGCEHLKRAVERCRPLIHCFGHIHEGWGAVRKKWSNTHSQLDSEVEEDVDIDNDEAMKERAAYFDGTGMIHGNETLFVNASIMNIRYKPSQAPWLVDVMLDAGKNIGPVN